MNVLVLTSLSLPLLGLLQFMWFYRHPKQGAKNLIIFSALGFLCNFYHLLVGPHDLRLGFLLASLIAFIACNIQTYAYRYLEGDAGFNRFFILIAALQWCALAMVLSTSMLYFWLFWTLSNLLLVKLMVHKSQWASAKASGKLARINFACSSILLGLGFLIIAQTPMQYHIYGKILLILAAMSQSAIFPLHQWLLSSLNSPTPVSALMHAGIVNAGGILLIKYQHLFHGENFLLSFIFIIGLTTAIIGGFWKLIQVDIKKMLANSTMAQMGFMFLQCGMGLFPAALAHLCWHGLFKAYLFLNSGSALQTKFRAERNICAVKDYFWIITATIAAIVCFAYAADLALAQISTQWVLLGLVGISAWQLSKNLVGKHHLFLDLFLVLGSAVIYGFSIRAIEACLAPGHINGLPLNPLFITGGLMLAAIWLVMNSPILKAIENTKFWGWLYIKGLNASQPSAPTMTSIRQNYDF